MDRARSKRIGPDRGILLRLRSRCVDNLWKQPGKPLQQPDVPIICRNSREQATRTPFCRALQVHAWQHSQLQPDELSGYEVFHFGGMGLRDNEQTRVLLHQFFADLFRRFGMTPPGRRRDDRTEQGRVGDPGLG